MTLPGLPHANPPSIGFHPVDSPYRCWWWWWWCCLCCKHFKQIV